MLVPEDGNSADFCAEFVRACGQRSATGSVTLSCRDGSPEPSPASPGCYLSIYLSMRGFIIHLNGPDSNHVTHQNEDGG